MEFDAARHVFETLGAAVELARLESLTGREPRMGVPSRAAAAAFVV